MKEELKREIQKPAVMFGISAVLSVTDLDKKIRKDAEDVNNHINQPEVPNSTLFLIKEYKFLLRHTEQ